LTISSLINDKVNDALNLLVGKMFEGNRLLDRMMSQLSIKFTMNHTSDALHPLLAHAMLTIVDYIGDYQDSRNALTEYPDTSTDKTEYISPLELFTRFYNYMEELEGSICDVIDIVENENDRMTKVFLEKFLLIVQPYTAQAILLVDKISMYGNDPKDWMQFDKNIDDFLIVEQLQGKSYEKRF
jgi:ferritin